MTNRVGKIEAGYALADLWEILGLQLEFADRVLLKCIDPERNHHHIRIVGHQLAAGILQRLAPAVPVGGPKRMG